MTKKVKTILIAPDKFKGSLTGEEVCSILEGKIREKLPDVKIISCPLADGGDGSLDVLKRFLDLELVQTNTIDPLQRSIVADYYRGGDTTYIELAKASGMVLLDKSEQNPMRTTTFGTGLQIKHALDHGCREVYLFLGGSSTNDGGMGMANALGYEFLDRKGIAINPCGSNLEKVDKIIGPVNKIEVSVTLFCDVENPPYGPRGAAQVYAKQKGASPQEIDLLDKGIAHYCKQVEKFSGKNISTLEGGGAAGGVAISMVGLLNAKIIKGMDYIAELTGLEDKIRQADLVISGEGRLDQQSLNGKVVSKIAEYCAQSNTLLWLAVGKNDLQKQELKSLGVEKIYALSELARDGIDPIENSTSLMYEVGEMMAEELPFLEK